MVVIADADEPGRRHAADVEAQLRGVAASVRVIEPLRGKDAADWIEAGGTVEEIEATAAADVASDMQGEPTVAPDPFEAEIDRAREEVSAALGKRARKRRKPLFSVDAADLLDEEFQDTQWLVRGLITSPGVAVVGGAPKEAKKTWFTTEVAVAVATGTKVCGEFVAKQGSVRYFYAEDTRRQIRNRIRALLVGAGRTIPKGALILEPRGEFIDIMQDQELAWIVASCRQGPKPSLVVLDPLSDIHSGEEDKRDSMRDVMRRLRLLGELVGCNVAANHHVIKLNESNRARSGGQRLRGSSSIHGSLDAGIYFMECDGDGVSVFTNTVQAEVKGARSAGKFTLKLVIEDDANEEAVCATWTVSREDAAASETGEQAQEDARRAARAQDDEKVLAFVRSLAMQGVRLSKRKLRGHKARPIAVNRMTAALNRVIKAGRLRLVGNKVHLPEAEQEDRA